MDSQAPQEQDRVLVLYELLEEIEQARLEGRSAVEVAALEAEYARLRAVL